MLEGQVAVLVPACSRAEGDAFPCSKALFAKRRIYRAGAAELHPLSQPCTRPASSKQRRTPKDGRANPLLKALPGRRATNCIISKDVEGHYRLAAGSAIAKDLREALAGLAQNKQWTAAGGGTWPQAWLAEVFNLPKFTGRSGAMYGYEGLGCIYWHMVTKLLLAVQERFLQHSRADTPRTTRPGRGLLPRAAPGWASTRAARVYGAFPPIPTPHAGPLAAPQQPGMTGQVKEEIIARWGELGLIVAEGQLIFRPVLLRPAEFLPVPRKWGYFDFRGQPRQLALSANSLGFTFCTTRSSTTSPPWRVGGGGPSIKVIAADGGAKAIAGLTPPPNLSRVLFARTGTIARIEVELSHALKPD